MKNVVIFGSFDVFHPGHEHFIRESAKFGNLIISVAQDKTIYLLKNKESKHKLEARVGLLKRKYPEHTITRGDNSLGDWSVIKEHKPEIVCIGYDQQSLGKELLKVQEKYNFRIKKISAFHSEKYKSKLLR